MVTDDDRNWFKFQRERLEDARRRGDSEIYNRIHRDMMTQARKLVADQRWWEIWSKDEAFKTLQSVMAIPPYLGPPPTLTAEEVKKEHRQTKAILDEQINSLENTKLAVEIVEFVADTAGMALGAGAAAMAIKKLVLKVGAREAGKILSKEFIKNQIKGAVQDDAIGVLAQALEADPATAGMAKDLVLSLNSARKGKIPFVKGRVAPGAGAFPASRSAGTQQCLLSSQSQSRMPSTGKAPSPAQKPATPAAEKPPAPPQKQATPAAKKPITAATEKAPPSSEKPATAAPPKAPPAPEPAPTTGKVAATEKAPAPIPKQATPAAAKPTPEKAPELYEKLREKTPSKKIQKMVNTGKTPPYPDPVLPGKMVTDTLDADHIVPMKKITEMPGFDKLRFDNQVKILNHKKNFVGLSKSANRSKGAKSFREWTEYKKERIKVDESFRKEMIEKEAALEKEIQDEINKLLNK